MLRNKLLRAVLINPSRLREWSYLLRILGVFILLLLLSILQGMDVKLGDFSVFWNAGDNFIHHRDLYRGIGGAGRFIYPPFAAMLFQLLALFPFKVAAGLLTFLNYVLFLFSIYLTRSILEFYSNDKKKIALVVGLAALLSFRFFWYHVTYIQLNELVFVLSLMGVLWMLKNKETPAVICFVTATFIKVIPLFFLIWLVFRGTFKTYLRVLIFTVLCLLVPLLWRGVEMGTHDLKDYYITFLEPFKEGRVEAVFHNHSLSSAIYNISLPMYDKLGLDFNLLHLTEAAARKVYFYSFFLLFGVFVFSLAILKIVKKPISSSEIAVVFLITHLLSGITWEYHLVSMLFVYSCLLLIPMEKKPTLFKVFHYLLIGLVVVNAIVGQDTVGPILYHYFGGYGAVTWMMVLLYFYFLYDRILNAASGKTGNR